MTRSRITSIIALIAAALSAAMGFLDLLPPKWAAVLTVVFTVVTSVNERLQGGASDPNVVQGTQIQLAEKRLASRAKNGSRD